MHPYIPELKELYRQGRVTRREFVQNATMLGLSLSAATAFLAACAQQQAAAPQPTVSLPATPTKPTAVPTPPIFALPTAAPTAAQAAAPAAATAVPTPVPQAAAGGVKRGGTIFVSWRVRRLPDPPTFQWGSEIARDVSEYLTEVDDKGVARPHLLEKFETTEDAKTWTLYVRKGINIHGMPKPRELDADDVIWNLKRWVNKETGGGMAALINYLKPTGIEKVDKYTVKLHLDRGEVGVPHHVRLYPALIMPREFEGGEWTAKPWGTGPFELTEFIVGERAKVKRIDGYWQNGADGRALPYVDEIVYTDHGEEAATTVAAFAVGQVDHAVSAVQPQTVSALEKVGAIVHRTPSAQTSLFRMRVDKKPWDDERVRSALKLSIDTQDMIKRAYPLGTEGFDCHANESQPDFVSPGTRKRDIAMAKQLLAEAGYPNGVDVALVYKADPNYEALASTVLKQHVEEAGIRVKLAPVPSAQFWDKWREYDFALTGWGHRPLATMNMALAYGCGSAWSETYWCDEEWNKMLVEASGTVDLEKRKKITGPLLKYIADHGPIANRFNLVYLNATSKRLKNYIVSAYSGAQLYKAWLDR
ncbi:MAG: hypothetical protein HY331_03815 [Chloroflexi bacterium]|nr:hypothetical protein [Chloroflexota bacterium]